MRAPCFPEATRAGAPSVTRISRALSALEPVGAVLAFLVLCSAFIPILRPSQDLIAANTEGDPITQVLLLAIYGAAGVLLLARPRAAWRIMRRDPWTLALVLLAVASASWSVAPDLTLRRGIGLLGTTLVGLYLAGRYDRATLARLLAWSLLLAAVASALVAVGAPSIGTAPAEGHVAWRGVYQNKNVLGRIMTLALLTLATLWGDRRMPRWTVVSGMALAGVLILLSFSKTALVAAVLLLALLPICRGLRMEVSFAALVGIAALLAAGIAALLVATESDLVLTGLGKDATLTGRTGLWELLGYYITQRTWLGYGFGAFWTSGNDAMETIVTTLRWVPPTAHNGVLDLVLAVGLAGGGLFLAGYALALWRAVRELRTVPGVAGLWPLAYLAFLGLYNLSDSTLLKQGSIFWVLYVVVACAPPALAPSPVRAPTPAPPSSRPVSLGLRRHVRRRVSAVGPAR